MRIFRFILISLLFFQCVPASAEELVAVAIDYCPYQCVPEKEEGKIGYVSELLTIIYGRAGYRIRFEQAPYKRGIKGVESGDYDLMPNVNEGHSQKMIFSKRKNGVLCQNFYVRKGNDWKYDGVESLRYVTTGSVLGYDYSSFSPDYEAYLKQYKDTRAVQFVGGIDGPVINLRKILKGRITTFNEDSALFNYVTKKNGIDGEFEVAGSLGENVQFIGFSPENPNAHKLARIYDAGIDELRASGELAKILAKYGLEDWEK